MQAHEDRSTQGPDHGPAGRLVLRSLRDLYYVLFRRGRTAVLTFTVVFVPVALLLLLRAPTYRSDAKLLVRLGRQTVTLDPTVATGKTVGVDQSRLNEINSELEILRSHDLLAEVAALMSGLEPDDDRRHAAAEDMRKRLAIEALEESSIIRIAYADGDRARARSVVSTLIERYLAKHIEVHRTEGSYEFFQQQASRLEEQIARQEEAIRDLRNRTGVASIEDQRRALIERLGAREGALEELRTSLAAARSGAQEDPAVGRLRDKLYELRLRELDLASRYEPTSPVVQAVTSQIHDVERLLGTLSTTGQDVQSAGLLAQIDAVEGQIAALRSRIAEINNSEVSIARLERELAGDMQSYRHYSESMEQARIDQALNTEKISNIRVVQPATMPVEPSGPSLAILLALALALAGVSSLGAAFALEYFDDSIDTPQRAEAQLRLPVLAALPETGDPSRATAPGPRTNGALVTYSELIGLRDQLWMWSSNRRRAFSAPEDQPNGRLPVGFLRLKHGQAPSAPAVIALTGCQTGSGVSTLAGHLSVLLAQERHGKVLLVNAGAAPAGVPASGPIEPLPPVAGSQGDEVSVYAKRLDLTGLRDPSEMDEAMWSLRREAADFEFVVMDLPAVPDTRATAQAAALCDGAILVVSANRTRWQVAAHSKERLTEAGVNLLGTVINRRDFPIPQWLYQTL